MTMWSCETVAEVRDLVKAGKLSKAMMQTYDRMQVDGDLILDGIRVRLTQELLKDTKALGVQIDVDDVKFGRLGEDETSRYFGARWWPATELIELRGGARDGEVLAVPDLHGGETLGILPSGEVVPTGRGYRLGGWSESHRRWVYDDVGKQ